MLDQCALDITVAVLLERAHASSKSDNE